jgi:imidazolonepropionase-like amidohydrolase
MRRRQIALILTVLAIAFSFTPLARAQAPAADARATQATSAAPAVVEHGKFILHKMEQPLGEETFETTRDGETLTTQINFKFTDRGAAVPLSVTLRTSGDLTPRFFEIKGKTARPTSIDEAVEVQGDKIRVRNRDKWTVAARPKEFFTIAGYAPATMQMVMVRYWMSHEPGNEASHGSGHGTPHELGRGSADASGHASSDASGQAPGAELETFPSGRVKIEPRGRDTVTVNGKDETLERYTIEGLIWGRETLWFDANRNLVAEVSIDAEFDHFEAMREGYESALGKLVAIAGTDGMAALADISKKISGSRAETLAIIGGTLIDGTGAAPVPDSAVLIQKGRIVAVGPRKLVRIPHGATKVDARGKTVLPGLWDMHAHFEQVEWGPIYLAAGVTTVRDCGNEFDFITAVRDAIVNGRGLGPRLLLAGIVDGTGPFSLGVERVDTPEQAKMWTDRYHEAGFQQIKIYSSVQLEELKIVAAEAHRLGMSVTGHVPEGLTAYQGIDAGMDMINHIEYVDDIMRPPLPANATQLERLKAEGDFDVNSPEAKRAVAFLVEHGTVIDPTLALFELYSASSAKPVATFEPGLAKVAPELAEELSFDAPPSPFTALIEKSAQKGVEVVGVLHHAGVPIVAGTDQAVPGHSLHREIELYVQAGFTPMEAIQAATIVPARAMGIDKEVGSIEDGKRADLIILGANPLEAIRNIRSVEFVVTNGVMYDCPQLWRSVGFKP